MRITAGRTTYNACSNAVIITDQKKKVCISGKQTEPKLIKFNFSANDLNIEEEEEEVEQESATNKVEEEVNGLNEMKKTAQLILLLLILLSH
jgi:hypothetical protein